MDKVRLIERSLRCRTLGWFALVPGVGVFPAVAAILLYYQVTSRAQGHWNPAEDCARLGFVLSWVGLGLSAILVGAVAAALVSHLL
jgi:hypothetical protein